jgi:peroxiredoxin
MPAFQSRLEKYSDDLVILAVNGQDIPEDMIAFMNELGLTFNALSDIDGEVHRQYRVRGLPTSFLVDKEGLLRVQHIGVMTEVQLDEYLFNVGLAD